MNGSDRSRRSQQVPRWAVLLPAAEPWRRFPLGLAMLTGVLLLGTAGYVAVGLAPFDALYQTAITVTTVGFGEVGPPGEIDFAYRLLTLVIVLLGAGSVLYVISLLLETVVEGSLNDGFRRWRMLKQVEKMEDHVVVAGYGRVGRAIAAHATRRGLEAVVVDRNLVETGGLPIVVGDANDDDTLLAAGIDRARSLVAALDTDTENLSLALTARSLSADLLIVARLADQRNERKFLRAGADRVVNPYEIGGARMGALAAEPYAAGFFDLVLSDEGFDADIHEVHVPDRSPVVGQRLRDVITGPDIPLVVAIHRAELHYETNPSADTRIERGDTLIVLGSQAQIEWLQATVEGRSA